MSRSKSHAVPTQSITRLFEEFMKTYAVAINGTTVQFPLQFSFATMRSAASSISGLSVLPGLLLIRGLNLCAAHTVWMTVP
jgi:hypothetical protein